MILSETPACYAHAQNVLMLHVGPGNLRLFGTFVPIRTPSGTLVQIRIRLRSFRLSTFSFVLFRHASIRRLCLFLVVCSFHSKSNNLRLPTRFELSFESTRQVALLHNLRLMTRMNKVQYQEPAVSWTEDEQHSGITKYGIQHY